MCLTEFPLFKGPCCTHFERSFRGISEKAQLLSVAQLQEGISLRSRRISAEILVNDAKEVD